MEITRSADGHQPTVARLIAAVQRRGLTLVSRIDHAGMAKDAGLDLSPVEVIVFGNPKVGTPLMITDPQVGIELPLRILVWADDQPNALIGYQDPRRFADEYRLAEHEVTLTAMATLLAALASEAAAAA